MHFALKFNPGPIKRWAFAFVAVAIWVSIAIGIERLLKVNAPPLKR